MPEGEGGTAVHLTDEKTKGGRGDVTSVGPGPASDLLSRRRRGRGCSGSPCLENTIPTCWGKGGPVWISSACVGPGPLPQRPCWGV